MRKAEVDINAKVTLLLNITGKADNGYHYLDMAAASVGIHDTVALSERSDRKITVTMTDAGGRELALPPDGDNSYKTYAALRDSFRLPGCDIRVIKRIPFSAGLGGSAADAAGVLRAAGKMFGLDIKSSSAYIVAFKSGSDVPYMLEGGFARVYGRGEKVDFLPSDLKFHLVIAKGGAGCSSRAAYAEYDKIAAARPPLARSVADMARALKANSVEEAAALTGNDLQAAATRLCPEIETTLAALRSTSPLAALVSGGGSACFGIYRGAAEAEAARERIKGKLAYCEACQTLPRGYAER